jgi:hypothetical protein
MRQFRLWIEAKSWALSPRFAIASQHQAYHRLRAQCNPRGDCLSYCEYPALPFRISTLQSIFSVLHRLIPCSFLTYETRRVDLRSLRKRPTAMATSMQPLPRDVSSHLPQELTVKSMELLLPIIVPCSQPWILAGYRALFLLDITFAFVHP